MKFELMSQPLRLIMRPITGTITILIPLAHHLNATEVLSIVMAMFVFCLVWETVASLRKGACFWEAWTDTEYPEKLTQQETMDKRVTEIP